MNLTFIIDYRTCWGESLYLTGDIPELGNGNHADAVKLELTGDSTWKATVNVDPSRGSFKYSYIVRNDNGSERNEYGAGHTFIPGTGVNDYELFDRWNDIPLDKPFYSVVFSDCAVSYTHLTLPTIA